MIDIMRQGAPFPSARCADERCGTPETLALQNLFDRIATIGDEPESRVCLLFGSNRPFARRNITSHVARLAIQSGVDPVLVLDASGDGIWTGPDILQAFRSGAEPSKIASPMTGQKVFTAATSRMKGLSSDDLGKLLIEIRRSFRLTLIDCGVVSHGTEVVEYTRHCDGSVMVANRLTSATTIDLSRTVIQRAGGRLLGIAVSNQNDRLERWVTA